MHQHSDTAPADPKNHFDVAMSMMPVRQTGDAFLATMASVSSPVLVPKGTTRLISPLQRSLLVFTTLRYSGPAYVE